MKVQRIRHPETKEASWIVLDDAYLPIEPITAYLVFLESLGRSLHTRRAIAHHLKLFWEFLHTEQVDWTEVDIARLASFISWLRRPDSALPSIAPQEAKRTNATIDQMLASVHGFYVMRDKSVPVNPVTRDERRCCLPCGLAKPTTGVKAKTSAPPHSTPHLRGLDTRGVGQVTRPEGTRSGLRQTADTPPQGWLTVGKMKERRDRLATPAERPLVPRPGGTTGFPAEMQAELVAQRVL